MREKELRRSLAVLPMGTVMKLTNLTARQIRYYEEQELVIPERNAGNRRMYSLNDIDKLLEIKDFSKQEVSKLWPEILRFENPHTYYVDLSSKLWNLKQELLLEKSN